MLNLKAEMKAAEDVLKKCAALEYEKRREGQWIIRGRDNLLYPLLLYWHSRNMGVLRMTLGGLSAAPLMNSERRSRLAVSRHLEVSFLSEESPEVIPWVIAHIGRELVLSHPRWLSHHWTMNVPLGKPLEGYSGSAKWEKKLTAAKHPMQAQLNC